MALHNRVEYGFNGYQVPPTPRAARSVRKRCLIKRNEDGQKQMCAFELLATLAGRLSDGKLSQHEDSSGDDENKTDKSSSGNSCYERNFMFTDFLSENSHHQGDGTSRPGSGLTSPNCSDKVEQLIGDECKLQLGISIPSLDSPPCDVKLVSYAGSEGKNGKQMKAGEENCRNLSMASNKAASCSRNQGVHDRWGRKSCDFVSSVDSLGFCLYQGKTARCSGQNDRDSVKLADRGYDESDPKLSEAFDRDKAFDKAPLRDGYDRFRKVTASKICKESADMKENQQYIPDKERCSLKNIVKEQRSLRDYPIKKRKLYDFSSAYNQEEGSSDGIYCVAQNSTIGIVNGSTPTMAGASAQTASPGGGYTSLHSRNQQVKLRIKSFRVPELCIEIPETATVGCLKRAVMEAVNEVLGGGLRVGVLLQGKKVREDGKTLLQTGISRNNRVDNLGFCLEPNSVPTQINNTCHKDHRRQLLHNSPQPLARYPPTLGIAPNGLQRNHHQQGNIDSPRSNISGTSLKSFVETGHDSAPSLDIVTSQKTSSESKAIVPLQIARPGAALSVIPLRKYKRSESAQRRIRRPFTVAEVEALVQAVEKLGTGRWRDVKLRAFDHAKHRTYVDLKDKWKTLVHTARISPQQRRGEPVPQELLDRVLTAHAYWSQQQAKQQLKSQHDICLLR